MGINNIWTIDEITILEQELKKGTSYQDIAVLLKRSKNGVAIKAQRLYRDKFGKRVHSKVWSDDEILLLEKLINKGFSPEKVAKTMNRSINSVTVKAQKLGLYFKSRCCKYREKEKEQFIEDWQNGSISLAGMATKYNRSKAALKIYAQKHKLGPRTNGNTDLTISDIVETTGVSRDRIYLWLKKGLKYKKHRVGKAAYFVKLEDLLYYMEQHQDFWNATQVDSALFMYEKPAWFTEKYRKDSQFYVDNWHREYTDKEDRQILALYKQGFTVEDIAQKLQRTESGIRSRLSVLSEGKMSPKYYTDEEKQVIINNAAYVSLENLIVLLHKVNPSVKRTFKGLEAKCKELGVEYHYTQKTCKKRSV